MSDDRPRIDSPAEAAAYIALRRLQNRYADIVTRRAWSELDQIITPDCSVTVDTRTKVHEMVGPADFGTFLAAALERFSFFQFVVLNTVMQIDTDAGTAAARMYIHELRQGRADGRRTDAFGVYHDRFVRGRDGPWWFADRHYQSFSRTAEAVSDVDQEVFHVAFQALDDG